MNRFVCILLGYLFGNFLTAELVVFKKTGKRAKDIGSGNPGMANVSAVLGKKEGFLVLAGDLLKTIVAAVICNLLFPELGKIGSFYAGLGTMLGHNFPCWNHFRGGKGVAVTCISVCLLSPLWGLFANIVGFLTVLLTGYLPLGAVIIPTSFILPAFFIGGTETGILSIVMAVIMYSRHYRGMARIMSRTEKRSGLCLIKRH